MSGDSNKTCSYCAQKAEGSRTMMEKWRDVVGYEGLYRVSNTGKIYSLKNQKELVRWNHSGGYLCVSLVSNLKKKNAYVHRIVAQAFISNPDKLPQINHKDENKRNNIVDNLEWCTPRYNLTYGTARLRCVQNTDFVDIGIKSSITQSHGAVCQYDIDGNFIARHTSANRASLSVCGKRNYNIYRCLRGEANTAYGYLWKYASGERRF